MYGFSNLHYVQIRVVGRVLKMSPVQITLRKEKKKNKIKALSTAMAQPVETATDHRHTHKYLGLTMVNVYGFLLSPAPRQYIV